MMITIVSILSILIAAYYLNIGIATNNGENPPTPTEEVPPGGFFVVPETPLGTLGLISATATAFIVLALNKKRKQAPT